MTTVAATSVVFQGCLGPVVAVSPASAGWGTWDTGATNVAALGARGVNASKFPAVRAGWNGRQVVLSDADRPWAFGRPRVHVSQGVVVVLFMTLGAPADGERENIGRERDWVTSGGAGASGMASSQPLRPTRPARGRFPKSVRRAPVQPVPISVAEVY